MKYREYLDFAHDISDSISEIERFINGMKYDDFCKDRKTINAVIRSLEVIGNAAKKIPDNVQKKYPVVPWKKIEARGDELIHKYFEVNEETIWNAASVEIPALKPLIEKIIDEEEYF